MTYFSLFIFLGAFFLLKGSTGTYRLTEENGYFQRQTTKGFALLIFLPIIYFAAFTPMIHGDLYVYVRGIQNLPTRWGEIVFYLAGLENSYLFWAFWCFVRSVFGNGETMIRLILTLFLAIPCIWFFRKYSDDYWLCVYIFVAALFPLSWMMNGVRQFAAAVIIYMATPYVVERRWGKWIALVLIAALVHQTAVIMLPIILVCQGKAWNWKTMLLILGAVIAAWIFSNVAGSKEDMLTVTGYSVTEYASDDGVHPLRVLVSFVPVIIAFLGRRTLEREDSRFTNLAINMSIVNAAIYLVGMVTSGILVVRVPAYTNLYSYILLTNMASQLFHESMEKIIKILMIMFFGLYCYVQIA